MPGTLYDEAWCRQEALRLVETGEWRQGLKRLSTSNMRPHKVGDEVIPYRKRGTPEAATQRWFILGSCHYAAGSNYRLLRNDGKQVNSSGVVISLMVRGLPPEILAWNQGVVKSLAIQARRNNDPGLALVLADALEEAGWENSQRLTDLHTPISLPRLSYEQERALNKIFATPPTQPPVGTPHLEGGVYCYKLDRHSLRQAVPALLDQGNPPARAGLVWAVARVQTGPLMGTRRCIVYNFDTTETVEVTVQKTGNRLRLLTLAPVPKEDNNVQAAPQ